MPHKTSPNTEFRALATARHIIDPKWAKCPGENPKLLFVRVNSKSIGGETDSAAIFLPMPLYNDGPAAWLRPDDPQIDAALVPVQLDGWNADFNSISIRDFPTDVEERTLSIGDPIVSAGLLPHLNGTIRNYPIFKFGQISSIPTEPIKTSCGQGSPPFGVKVALVAANLVPGNSGSPIFYVPGGGGGISFGGRPLLLGVQSFSYIGADVSGMTPVRYLYEMLRKHFDEADLERGPQKPNEPAVKTP
jgi:hypothetical protein